MFTLNSTEHHAVAAEAYGICSYDSNAMKSPNPNSGFYKADTSRTLDLNGGSPACNQGGVAVVEEVLPFDTTQVTSPYNGNNPHYGDPCHPLAAGAHPPSVAYCPEIAHTLSARHDGSPQPDKGNGAEVVAVGVDTYNHAVTGDVACALTAVGAGDPTKSGPSVLSAGFSFGQSAKARSIGYGEEVSPTLRGGEGDHQNRVTDYTAVVTSYQETTGTLSPGAHPGSYNGQDAYNDMLVAGTFQNTGQGWWNESDVGATVRTPCGGDSTKANLVAAVDCRNGTENPDTNGTLQAKEQGQNLNSNNVVRTGEQRGGGAYMSVVRRLTPLE